MEGSREITSECSKKIVDSVEEFFVSLPGQDSVFPSDPSDLHSAIQRGDLERVKVLVLQEGASVDNSSDPCVQNPLMIAVVNEHLPVIHFLLSRNADVNQISSCCKRSFQVSTPLCMAVEQGNSEICSLLLDQKANVDIENFLGLTPLLIAIEKNSMALVTLLFEKRPQLQNFQTENQINPLAFAAELGKEEMVQLFLDVDFQINVEGSKEEKSLLYYAAMFGNVTFASHLVGLGFDIHESGNDEKIHVDDDEGIGWKRLRHTPLYTAAKEGHTEMVRFLLGSGADINRGGKLLHDTPLYIASATGQLPVVEVLIKKKATYDALNGVTNFFSPLYVAVVNGHVKVAEYLICIHKFDGRNIKYKDAYGNSRTALSLAAEIGSVDMVKLLLVSYFEKPKEGDEHSPLHYAVKNSHEDVVKLLLTDYRINVNICSRSKKVTPLFHANVQMAELLLSADADPNTVDDHSSDSPLSLAARQSNSSLVWLLLAHGARVEHMFGPIDCEVTRQLLWSAAEMQRLHLRTEDFNYLELHMNAYVSRRKHEVPCEETVSTRHSSAEFTEYLLGGRPLSEYRLDQWLPYSKWEIQDSLLTKALEIIRGRFKVRYLFSRHDKPDFTINLATLPTWDYKLWKRYLLHDGIPVVTTRILSFLTFTEPLHLDSVQEILTYFKALKREHPTMFLRLKKSRISKFNTGTNEISGHISKKTAKYEQAMVDLKTKQNTAIETARLAYTANACASVASEAAEAALIYADACAAELTSAKAKAAATELMQKSSREKRQKN